MEYASITSPIAPTPKEQRVLETISNEIVIARNRAEEHLMALSAIADRVFGPQPQPPQEANTASPPFSEIDAIHTELRRFRDIQADISSQIDRLRNL